MPKRTPDARGGRTDQTSPWSPWRVVLSFGFISLAIDIVSDGARSISGPLLGELGATALVVGVVTGLGEAIALALRLLFGPWADRTRRYWTFTRVGYVLTAVSVPLLAVTPFVGGAGLALAIALILTERLGKAVRSPAKTVLLANAAGAVGRGRGFAVHKSLDQLGAFLGPLLVSAVIAVTALLWPALAVLVIPATAAIMLLAWVRSRAPDMRVYEGSKDRALAAAQASPVGGPGPRLPATFYLFAAAAAASTAGLVSFGVISFHLTDAAIVPLAAVPLFFAAAMGVAALAALASGYLYDRRGTRVLLVLPLLVALIPGLALSEQVGFVVAGVMLWGAAVGIQDSTVKALVADLVQPARRGTAYGIFAAGEGAAALVGGVLAGALYDQVPTLIAVVAVLQALALALLLVTGTLQRRSQPGDSASQAP